MARDTLLTGSAELSVEICKSKAWKWNNRNPITKSEWKLKFQDEDDTSEPCECVRNSISFENFAHSMETETPTILQEQEGKLQMEKRWCVVPHRRRTIMVAAGHDHIPTPESDGSQHAVEAFWKNLVRKNFELLRGSWSILELLV
eukprot:9497102-Pyramimonas_sp.AAC.1